MISFTLLNEVMHILYLPQATGQPISDRYLMHTEIPAAFDSYGQAFIHYKKILDLYSKKV